MAISWLSEKILYSEFERTFKIGVDETITVEDLEVGTYEVGLKLSSVASNCTRSVNGYSSVDIQQGQITTHEFSVTCEATGAPLEQGKLVFESASDGNIQISNIDGTTKDDITSNDDYSDENPAVSPDLDRIAFTSDRDSEGLGDYDLYMMDFSGENIRKIADNEGRFYYSWSPDGTELVILDDGEASIINSDGSNRRFLADNVSAVDWSPDGSEIAIADNANAGTIKFLSPDGSELRSFNISPVVKYRDLEYAPDGSELIFTADFEDDKGVLYFVNVDGSDVRHVFSSNYDTFHDPSWSPDGSKFAFQEATHTPVYDSSLIVVDIDEGTRSQPFHPSDVSDPFWIPPLE